MSKKPISPHLSIYKIQITSLLSILHRMTGLLLIFGLTLFAIALFCIAKGNDVFHDFLHIYKMCGGFVFQWGIIFALHYHALNGIRYLLWTKGLGFDIKTVALSGWVIITISVCMTYVLFCFSA